MPDDKKPEPAPKPAEKPELPAVIKLKRPYAFWEGEGEGRYLRQWAEGARITDRAEIELLVGRGAEYWVPK